MSRPIKFRAWHKEERKMFDCYSVSFRHGQCGLTNFGMELWERLVLMQFTGLLDKNGKEIYEGDIMSFKADKSSPTGGQYCGTMGFHSENSKVVEWDEDRWSLGNWRLSGELKMYEVIGNIHTNPELLNK